MAVKGRDSPKGLSPRDRLVVWAVFVAAAILLGPIVAGGCAVLSWLWPQLGLNAREGLWEGWLSGACFLAVEAVRSLWQRRRLPR